MSIHLDDNAFKTAASDMEKLKERNNRLRQKLERMYKNLTTALNTPAGHAMEIKGKDVLLDPIDDMGRVIDFMALTLNAIIGQSGSRGVYYDKLFDEYEELDRILRNKSTH